MTSRPERRRGERGAGFAFLLVLSMALVSTNVLAQGVPPWVQTGKLPLPDDARSVSVLRRNEALFSEPNAASPRRGAAAIGAHLPLYGAVSGPGCNGDYFLVGPSAWVCSDVVAVSSEPPWGAEADAPSGEDGLPTAYYFVGSDGAFGYSALESATDGAPTAQLEPGFAVSVVETRSSPRGDPFGLTTKGVWLPLENLNRVRPVTFHGYDVVDGRLDRGFVVAESAPLYDAPAGKRLKTPKTRFETVPILETKNEHGKTWARAGDGEWLDAGDLRLPALSSPPKGAATNERWIDVDLATQTLTAYEGKRPVYATLVSTGIGGAKDVTATPVGVHRVWVKLRTSDMTNLEDQDALRYYAMQEVPWVLFFDKGVGLHGAFWHKSFGHVRSHGCVNLTPLDAERLFRWSGPLLPAGWTAVLPTVYDPGTLVRVR